jgi:hypothetical protein
MYFITSFLKVFSSGYTKPHNFLSFRSSQFEEIPTTTFLLLLLLVGYFQKTGGEVLPT